MDKETNTPTVEVAAPIVEKATNLSNIGKPPAVVEPPKEHLAMEFKMPGDLKIAPIDKAPTEDNKGLTKEEKKVTSNSEKVVPTKEEKTEATSETEAEVPAKEEKKAEAKSPLDILKKPAQKKDEQRPVEGADKRDYSVFDSEEERAAAKQMSNAGFELAKKLKVATKTANQDAIFYQHPEAYVTHPEYKKLNEDVAYAQKEAQIWTQQLMLAKAGKPFQQLLRFDAQGNPVMSQPIESTPEYEESLRQAVMTTRQQAEIIQQKVAQFGDKYKQEFTNYKNNFQAERAKRFAWAADPALLDSTIDLGADLGEKSLRQIKQDFVSLFPAHLVNDTAVEAGSDLLVGMLMQKKFYEDQIAKLSTKAVIAKEEEDVEPSTSVRPKKQSSAFNGVTEFSIKGMPTVS